MASGAEAGDRLRHTYHVSLPFLAPAGFHDAGLPAKIAKNHYSETLIPRLSYIIAFETRNLISVALAGGEELARHAVRASA